jgi:hypothetical protein
VKRNGRHLLRTVPRELLPDVDGRELVFPLCPVCGRPVRHTASVHGYARSKTRHEGCVLYARGGNYIPRGNDQDIPAGEIERRIAVAERRQRDARRRAQ